MYKYDCPQCGEVINLVDINGALEGYCKHCKLEINLEKAEWIESLKDKLNLM
jgi:uncharacterized paraquat-inducible protein A